MENSAIFDSCHKNGLQLRNRMQVYEVYPPLVNTDFSAEIGVANGIPASEVADEVFLALEKNQFDVPVGDSKLFFQQTK